jgi:hypothetical protein
MTGFGLSLGALSVLARGISESELSVSEKFAQTAQTSNVNSTTKRNIFILHLRALRVLRGENYPVFFGCGFAALGPCGESFITQNPKKLLIKFLKSRALLRVARELSKRVWGLFPTLITHRRKPYGNG